MVRHSGPCHSLASGQLLLSFEVSLGLSDNPDIDVGLHSVVWKIFLIHKEYYFITNSYVKILVGSLRAWMDLPKASLRAKHSIDCQIQIKGVKWT